MRIQKFQASDMREAIAQVKKSLGPDAVIVATREIRRGLIGSAIEVTDAIDTEEPAAPQAPAPSAPRPVQTGINETDIERILLPIRSDMRTLRTFLKPVLANRTDDLRADIEALRSEISGRLNEKPRIEDALNAPNFASPSTGRM